MISAGENTRALMLVTNLPHMTENTYTAELHSALEQEKKSDIVSIQKILELLLTSFVMSAL